MWGRVGFGLWFLFDDPLCLQRDGLVMRSWNSVSFKKSMSYSSQKGTCSVPMSSLTDRRTSCGKNNGVKEVYSILVGVKVSWMAVVGL
ncbi:hypothetical protein B0J13DRAFT_576954 [Dactylonectria estremocensis]|uniref:Uncharacterized protein n=1 Tax=Dactylonectria estremocensis TaxID=1079267 RepID=A0A9P9D155_9HYPO|nr:hypothetical protein B0J13DRAFT_576954 [Dactylonectria estremocensis]